MNAQRPPRTSPDGLAIQWIATGCRGIEPRRGLLESLPATRTAP